MQTRKMITLDQIDPKALQRLKTLGVQNGQKNSFSLPINGVKDPLSTQIKAPPPQSSSSRRSPSTAKETKKIDLNSLGVSKEFGKSTGPNILQAKKSGQPSKNSLQSLGGSKSQQIFQEVLKKNLEVGPTADSIYNDLFRSTGLNVYFNPPEGVQLNELNALEMKYYSFNKRVYEAYITSILSVYRQFKFQNPHIHFQQIGPQNLMAKVSYDENGQIKEINFLKNAQHDKIQSFFQDVLEETKIPNPPQEFIKARGEFHLTFQLILNSDQE